MTNPFTSAFTTDESPRASLMKFFRDTARGLRGGAYYVRRGVINWNTYFANVDAVPAIAIVADQGSLLPIPGRPALTQEGQITFEMFARVQEKDTKENMDEELIDCFIEDARYLLGKAIKDINSSGRIAFRIPASAASFTERHDLDKGVQGILVTFTINY